MGAEAPARPRHAGLTARAGPGAGAAVVMVLVVAIPAALALLLDGTTYDTWGGVVWIPVVMALAFPLCRWVATRTGEPALAGFFFAAAALKIVVGALARRHVVEHVYGSGDAYAYDRAAGELVDQLRRGDLSDLGQITGTRSIEILTGVVQAVIGETLLGTYVVFSAVAFVGLCLFYVAFHEALPSGDSRLYRRLLFLTPTLWFWPSGIGKEAFLMLCVGGAAFGFAQILNGRMRGLASFVLGLWGAGVVRPHVALMILVGVVAALPAIKLQDGEEHVARSHRLTRMGLPLLVLLALPFVLNAAETFFGIDGLNLESATEVREEVVRRTSGPDSEVEFAAPDVTTPLGMAQATVTVVARPFPWEADGLQRLAALEGVVLVTLSAWAVVRRGRAALRALIGRWPRFAIGFVLSFAWGFSAVSNFGILARQRSLMLPFLFVVVAAARLPRAGDDVATARSAVSVSPR